MKCPVCGKELDGKNTFCQNCGQAISQSDTSSTSFTDYWNENNAASEKFITKQKERTAEVLAEIHKKRIASFLRFVILCVAICAIVFFVIAKKMYNQQLLSTVHESMIGKTYSDEINIDSKSWWIIEPGESYDRLIVTIVDSETLEYTKGNYCFHLDSVNGDYKTSWSENEVYEATTYAYDLAISFWGKVSILINDEAYEVDLDDDDTVSSINFNNPQ